MNIRNYNLSISLLLLFIFFQNLSLSAQIVLERESDNGIKKVTCGNTTLFTDDNTYDNILYEDNVARSDQLVICPNGAKSVLNVVFSQFDLAPGDQLDVYNGDLSAGSAPFIASMSGSGVSSANGGWIQSSCNPGVNGTGCLTFIFVTNGDNGKGTGWRANISCEANDIEIECADDVSAKDDCNNPSDEISVTFRAPIFTSCNGTVNLDINLSGCSSANLPSTVSSGQRVTGKFPLGTHAITASLPGDASKSCTFFISVDQGPIVCNDNVRASLNAGCEGFISIDGILENPCYGNGVSYDLEVTLEKNRVLKKSINATTNRSLSDGLTIGKSDFNCNKTYDIKITRNIRAVSCSGSTNTLSVSCTGGVRFEDNTPPIINASPQTITTCGEVSPEEIKEAISYTVVDFCDVENTTVNIGRFPSNFCSGTPSVEVTIVATDQCGNTARKTVDVQIKRPTVFIAPVDTLLVCGSGTDPSITGYPTLDIDGDGKGDIDIIENTCNYTSIYSDRDFSGNSSGIKIVRTWQISDWCRRNGAPINIGSQVIEVRDYKAPTITCPEDKKQGTFDNPYRLSTASNCQGGISLTPPSATDDCDGSVTPTLIRIVDAHRISRTYTATEDLPVGTYYAEYRAIDASNNRSPICKVYFTMEASSVPSALCVDQLNVSFSGGDAKIKASDLDAGSSDNCSSVSLFIRKEGGDWTDQISFSCEEARNEVNVYLRVLNSNGGENTCWVSITGRNACSGGSSSSGSSSNSGSNTGSNTGTDDDANTGSSSNTGSGSGGSTTNNDNNTNTGNNTNNNSNDTDTGNDTGTVGSSSSYHLKGKVSTLNGEALAGVDMKANRDNFELSALTDAAGEFDLMLPSNVNYMITPTKNTDMINGVSVIDLVLMLRHILNITPFDSPYKYVAADLNLSGSVTTFDVVQLRKLILNAGDPSVATIPGWRFLDGDLLEEEVLINIRNLDNPTPIESLAADRTDLHFTAIKVGDLNGSASASGLLTATPRTANGTIPITLLDMEVKKGDIINVPLQVTQIKDLLGLQIALQTEALEIINIDEGLATTTHFQQTRKDKVAIVWDNLSADQLEEETLLTLQLQAQQDGRLSEFIRIDKESITAEAFNKAETAMAIDLSFTNLNLSAKPSIQLLTNTPNPFKEATKIAYTLDADQAVYLEVYDLQGATVFSTTYQGTVGYNETLLTKDDLKVTGLLIYELRTADAVVAGKMIRQ